jgi:ferredoxin
MPTVNFVNEKIQIEVPAGSNLRTEARKAGVQLYPLVNRVVNCHGFGQCGSCRVLITKGIDSTSKKGIVERVSQAISLSYIGNEATMRLACQTRVEGDIDVVTQPPLNLFGESFFS